MRNLPCHFATVDVECRPVLRLWCINPKEIEGKKHALNSLSVHRGWKCPFNSFSKTFLEKSVSYIEI
jgi:hypothetical protein